MFTSPATVAAAATLTARSCFVGFVLSLELKLRVCLCSALENIRAEAQAAGEGGELELMMLDLANFECVHIHCLGAPMNVTLVLCYFCSDAPLWATRCCRSSINRYCVL